MSVHYQNAALKIQHFVFYILMVTQVLRENFVKFYTEQNIGCTCTLEDKVHTTHYVVIREYKSLQISLF